MGSNTLPASAEQPIPPRPADRLMGRDLDNGWTVVEKVSRAVGSTGGMFSVSYLVSRASRHGTQEAFLKALDFSKAAQSPSPVDALRAMTDAYTFERDLVLRCTDRGMKNVVRALDHGSVQTVPDSLNPFDTVPYLIFEIARDKDLRSMLVSAQTLELAWKFRALHGVCTGLQQLHSTSVAHQDLKPSNVMLFPSEEGHLAKVGDLGRSWISTRSIDHNNLVIAGDPQHAPPELLYGHVDPDQYIRRFAVDLYHLGSLMAYLFTGTPLTGLLLAKLPPAFHWTTWPNSYQNVLPYVRSAFDEAVESTRLSVPEVYRGETEALIRALSDPDPHVRGYSAGNSTRQRISLNRFVTRFDLLSRKIAISR